ncbi:hypothetical protein GZ77_08030 [Endozoicomonas montiporae]|uniref:Uncharacterized protein n=2 Tax=Endozoicomonas montiporae TaxID=1027273 RepID=A0A081N7B4_9GAMM|nr:hypothetical protein [Endozoicomonas montiporae]AMO55831.1 hypothetical protein EZMO1_1682 [Endozoicomonas montiporae CL-33]KEQ14337.1 hypothetical protein GZ77_08030 [Endozoicomonas montiporae]
MDITEEYEDVLQNLEFPIMDFYHQHRVLEDWEVKRALEATIEHYRAEYSKREPKNMHLSDAEDIIMQRLITVCEWRLGRVELDKVIAITRDFAYQFDPENFIKTSEELQKCLKRIIKSVERWSREGGRQGYLTFTSQYFPQR